MVGVDEISVNLFRKVGRPIFSPEFLLGFHGRYIKLVGGFKAFDKILVILDHFPK